uniref:Transposase-associated domain-containing protein n=1 Tax=Tanacetum cinerariifolium TaxID=118510 RepID=A0A6L2L362_TANCI|nr:hypothetical protein [Tanacetum cinerariifolium]
MQLVMKASACQIAKRASPTQQLRQAFEQGCDVLVKDLDVVLALVAKKERKMKQEEAETNLQTMRDFILCLRKQKLEELYEVHLCLSISFVLFIGGNGYQFSYRVAGENCKPPSCDPTPGDYKKKCLSAQYGYGSIDIRFSVQYPNAAGYLVKYRYADCALQNADGYLVKYRYGSCSGSGLGYFLIVVNRKVNQIIGVNEFLDFAYRNKQVSSKVPCHCKDCNNYRKHSRPTILRHLMQRGITVSYENWIHHGEPYDDLDDSDDDMPSSEDSEGDNVMDDDDLDEMLNNIMESRGGVNWHSSGESSSTLDKDVETLRLLLDESHQELYTGCQTFSKFSFTITILHLKTKSGWTIRSFDFMLDVFRKALPTPSLVLNNFYEAKKYIRDLGFYGEKIHVCVNDCVLYQNKYSYTQCPNVECEEPRFLPPSHLWRRDKMKFDRKVDYQVPVAPKFAPKPGNEILNKIDYSFNTRKHWIFPPSFFDIMVHLLIHLPYEAKISGPPEYRWIFSFDRKMRTLKGYVKNQAHPEGCIYSTRYRHKISFRRIDMVREKVTTIDSYEIAHYCEKKKKMVSEEAVAVLVCSATMGHSAPKKEILAVENLRAIVESEKNKSTALEKNLKEVAVKQDE